VTGAGLAPLPVQQPIPVWIGTASERGYERAGRIADGWFPMVAPGPRLDEARGIVVDAAIAAGRDPSTIGMEGRVNWTGDADRAGAQLAAWAEAGASHLSVNTMGAGLRTVDDHLAVLAEFATLHAPA
jgi:alkanesulfonate monooxygenase SsuD/methylene tetrahydromethanopterin reductase-like flavin-dependent oxidoreductase (luciferase family)